MAWYKKLLKQNQLLFIQGVPTQFQNFMHIGLQLIIERHMEFMPVTVFFLIMKVPEEVKRLSQEK